MRSIARFFLARLDPRLALALREQRRSIVAGLICSAVAAGIVAGMALFAKEIVAAVEAKDSARLVLLSLAVIVVFGVKYWFTRGQAYYLSKAANRLSSDLRLKLFAKLQRLPIGYFNEKRSGAIQSVLTNDVNVFQTAVAVIRDAIDGPIKIVGGLATIFYLQWQLALAACVVIPLMTHVIQRNGRKMRVAQADVQSDLASLTAMMQESLQGTRVIKAFNAERTIEGRFGTLVENSFRSQMRAARRIANLKPLVELIGAVALSLVVLLCAVLVSRHALSAANLTGFLIALDTINQGARNLGSLNQTLSQVGAATERIYAEVLDQPENLADAPGARVLERVEGRVEFRGVGFCYPDGTRALSNVSFVIEPGESLALVGPSGAGKSTIADLLLRFYDPTEGQILLDGVDLRDLQSGWLRSQMGVVPQQTFLFAGSIADNLRLGAEHATEEDLRQAAEIAHASAFIDSMPNGLESELGERGVRLSGGEGQRLAIARAVVRRPKILLLDEATSNLDSLSERAVQSALEEVMHGRTTLFIAHRLSTAARADRILVLRHGEVLETGTHVSLMESDGAYAGMYRAFSSGVLDGAVG